MGLVRQKAKSLFLARELSNWDWLKKERKADIAESVTTLEPSPRFGKVKLWLHQKVAFLLMIMLKRFMLFLDMGGGKTLLCLMVIKYLKKCGVNPKAIVFVPYVITVDTWIEETEKWTKLKCVSLVNNSEQNLKDLQTVEGDLYVISYQSAVAMLASKKRNEGELKKGQKRVDWKLDGVKVRKLFKKLGFNVLIMDEIHKCKNVSSMTYRMCRAISKDAGWVFGLTGTPFGRNLEDLWAQYFLVDLGETLGTTIGFYRAVFFKELINYWGGYEYRFDKKMKPILISMIKNRSIRYKIDEFADMPKRTYVPKHVVATTDVASYYNKIIDAMKTMSFDTVKYRQIESEYIKLRQLSSGFLTVKGDDKSKVEVNFPVNPKLDALQDLSESMPDGCKMIIFHDFVHSNEIISKRLKELKVNHARVWGKGKNNLKELRRFKKDPKCTHLVINCQSGSSSQNLQMANYVVYFEQPRSAIDREQSERRAWRPGQKKRVFFFDLIMRDTYDEKQIKYNQEGKDLLKSVLDKKVPLKKLAA